MWVIGEWVGKLEKINGGWIQSLIESKEWLLYHLWKSVLKEIG